MIACRLVGLIQQRKAWNLYISLDIYTASSHETMQIEPNFVQSSKRKNFPIETASRPSLWIFTQIFTQPHCAVLCFRLHCIKACRNSVETGFLWIFTQYFTESNKALCGNQYSIATRFGSYASNTVEIQ